MVTIVTPSTPAATPQKNVKAFASSRAASSTLWFERKQSLCLSFTNDGKFFLNLRLCTAHPWKVPIYDASDRPFLFRRDDFAFMQGLPRYKKYGVRSWSDLPHQSLVSVFTLNTYPKDYSSSSGADTGTSAPPRSPHQWQQCPLVQSSFRCVLWCYPRWVMLYTGSCSLFGSLYLFLGKKSIVLFELRVY